MQNELKISLSKTNFEPYFTCSAFKLILMSIATSNLYQIYWFYKNWQSLKSRGLRCNAALRSMFSIFFIYNLFSKIKDSLANTEMNKFYFPIKLLALIYILLTLIDLIPSYVALISSLNVIPLVVVNNVANRINEYHIPEFKTNDEISFLNIIFITFGLVLTFTFYY